LLDNITINTCFNKIIYKIILDEEINLSELVFIDKAVIINIIILIIHILILSF